MRPQQTQSRTLEPQSFLCTEFFITDYMTAGTYPDRCSLCTSLQASLHEALHCVNEYLDVLSVSVQGGTERGGEAALTAFVMLAVKDIASSNELAGGFACLEDGLLLTEKTLYSQVGGAYSRNSPAKVERAVL